MSYFTRFVRAWTPLTRAAGLCLIAATACGPLDSVDGDDEKDFPERPMGPDAPAEMGVPNGCDLTGTWLVHLTSNASALGLASSAQSWFFSRSPTRAMTWSSRAAGTVALKSAVGW